jgi:hypothetical protein
LNLLFLTINFQFFEDDCPMKPPIGGGYGSSLPPPSHCLITENGLLCYLLHQQVMSPTSVEELVPWITGWEDRRLLGPEAEQLAITLRSKARDEAMQEQQQRDAEDRAQRMANNQRVLEERRKLAASSEKAKDQQNGEDEEKEDRDGVEKRDLKTGKGDSAEKKSSSKAPTGMQRTTGEGEKMVEGQESTSFWIVYVVLNRQRPTGTLHVNVCILFPFKLPLIFA